MCDALDRDNYPVPRPQADGPALKILERIVDDLISMGESFYDYS